MSQKNHDNAVIAPGATIGIIGGGQLGRMMAQAAAELGYKTHIYCPEKDCPASFVATHTTTASYTDEKSLATFADSVDVVTFEFENIPHKSLILLESKVPVRPSAKLLELSQNRIREKTFVNELGIATTPFERITEAKQIIPALKKLGGTGIIKTTELGYDGKGQAKLDENNELEKAWNALNTKEAILEALVDFTMEISVIVVRNTVGEIKTYVPVQNKHKHHILDETIAPAPITKGLADKATGIAIKIAEAAKLVGLLAVEMFVTRDNKILVNELAPRPHNSGHWTMDACITGQFEQAIRAVCGLPLGSPERLCDAVMKNLIGDEVNDWPKYAADSNYKVHLYGKKEARKGRKMGHVTKLLTN